MRYCSMFSVYVPCKTAYAATGQCNQEGMHFKSTNMQAKVSKPAKNFKSEKH